MRLRLKKGNLVGGDFMSPGGVAKQNNPLNTYTPNVGGGGGKERSSSEGWVQKESALVLWTDGSKIDQGNAGAAVCWRDKRLDRWKEKSVFLGKNKEILDAELWAIYEALSIAEKETQNARNTPVTVFCDSQKALKAIEHRYTQPGNRFLTSLIYQKTQKIQGNGSVITIRWIPGHSGLPGNEKADLLAKTRAEKGGRLVERWSSLAYIKKNLLERYSKEITKWHETKTQERETSRRGYYVPWTKNSLNPTLGNAPKKYASRYYQLKVGHGAVGTFLARIGVIETSECWWCGETKQSAEHLYIKCRRWRKKRRKLMRELRVAQGTVKVDKAKL